MPMMEVTFYYIACDKCGENTGFGKFHTAADAIRDAESQGFTNPDYGEWLCPRCRKKELTIPGERVE